MVSIHEKPASENLIIQSLKHNTFFLDYLGKVLKETRNITMSEARRMCLTLRKYYPRMFEVASGA
jgi:hypothetical protein